jgi:hypothetical protein
MKLEVEVNKQTDKVGKWKLVDKKDKLAEGDENFNILYDDFVEKLSLRYGTSSGPRKTFKTKIKRV